MFALQYQDSFLELADGENPVIRWVATTFNNSEDLLGSKSVLSFEFAETPGNHARLSYANQLAARLKRTDIEVTIWLFDMPWKRCMVSLSLKNGRITGFAKIDNGEFATIIKERDLAQIFVKTSNGVFVDHDWIFVGNSNPSTVAAVVDSLTPGAAPYTFYPYINTALFGDYSGEEGQQQWTQPRIINRWEAGGFQVGTILPEDLKSHWYTPSLYLTWVIKKVCAYLGYEATGDVFEDEFIISLVIDNNSVYSETEVFSPDGFKIAPARHLPKIKLNEFFKHLREQFKIIYYFNSDTKKAHFVLSDTVLADDERIEINVERFKPTAAKTEETGYELIQGIDDKDELFKVIPYVKSFFIGDDRVAKKVELPISTCFMRKEQNPDHPGSPVWRIPMKKQLGNAYSDRAIDSQAHNPVDYGRNDFGLRLLSYRGMMADGNGNFYPYATSDGLDVAGEISICPSLWLGGESGILERYQRSWYAFYLMTELVELVAYLPNIVLRRMSPLKKIRFQTDEGIYLEALMDEVEFRADRKERLLKADIKVYPNYNVSALIDASNTQFASGDIVNEATVYVKLIEINYERTYRRPFPGAKTLYWISADIIAEFYSDAGGTIPVSVNGLVLTVINEKVTNGSYSTFTNHFTCYGDTFTVIENLITWYHKGDKTETQKFVLADGNGYFKIS